MLGAAARLITQFFEAVGLGRDCGAGLAPRVVGQEAFVLECCQSTFPTVDI